ncbi:glycosyltransferase family 39 protein [Aestuariimicrobium sp. T2.26MG-19.2B]|uniref:glycosyltransferase family 39 protein n=1 Tax=Aestuariimicrobium sp. T2.26MG-19.2B TaxID=3040679 RepID=UPI00247730F7|nr:hypothetical protein [Aestuariimicrobium sp. T2.26MG-19.2B]CAI9406259.1 hypothetical protein AESSP_01590 [Aestuariimicrobium sp. T2.26MG-19.2B]
MSVPSLWADEGATLSAVQRSWPQLWALLGHIDAVHGVYYALMKVWLGVAPINAFTLRLPSLLAVGALVALSHMVARVWFSRGWATVVAVLLALLPRTTWMAIEGRSWAIGSLVVLAATFALVKWVQNRRTSALVLHALLLAVGISMNIYVVFLVVAHGVSLLIQRLPRPSLVRWGVAVILAIGAAAPVVVAAGQQRGQLGDRQPLGVIGWARDVVVNQFALGDTPGGAATWVPQTLWAVAAVGFALVGWCLVLVATVRAVMESRSGAERSPSRQVLVWALPWVAIPPFLVLVASLVTQGNLYHPRYFAFTAPAFALAVASGLQSLGGHRLSLRRARAVVAALLVVLSVPVQLSQRDTNSKGGYDWSQVAAVVSSRSRAGDGVYFGSNPPTRVVSLAYPSAFGSLTDVTVVQTPAAEGSLDGEAVRLTPEVLQKTPRRLWAIWSDRDRGEAADLSILVAAGYSEAYRWSGSESTVVLMER